MPDWAAILIIVVVGGLVLTGVVVNIYEHGIKPALLKRKQRDAANRVNLYWSRAVTLGGHPMDEELLADDFDGETWKVCPETATGGLIHARKTVFDLPSPLAEDIEFYYRITKLKEGLAGRDGVVYASEIGSAILDWEGPKREENYVKDTEMMDELEVDSDNVIRMVEQRKEQISKEVG